MSVDIRLTPSLGFTSQPDLLGPTDPLLIMQRVRIRLGRHLGEWFLDPAIGLPWTEWQGRRGIRDLEILDPIRAEILAVNGVEDVLSLALERNGSQFTITGQILLAGNTNTTPIPFGVETFGIGRVRIF